MKEIENQSNIEYLEFETEEERKLFASAIASIPQIKAVADAIVKNKMKNRGFRIDVELEDLKKCGLDPLVKLRFKKVRNQDNTYDLDFTFKKI